MCYARLTDYVSIRPWYYRLGTEASHALKWVGSSRLLPVKHHTYQYIL